MVAQPNQPDRDPTLIWRKSSASSPDGGCVEVTVLDSFVLVRDSRSRSGAVLAFTSVQWLGLLRRIRSGEEAAPR